LKLGSTAIKHIWQNRGIFCCPPVLLFNFNPLTADLFPQPDDQEQSADAEQSKIGEHCGVDNQAILTNNAYKIPNWDKDAQQCYERSQSFKETWVTAAFNCDSQAEENDSKQGRNSSRYCTGRKDTANPKDNKQNSSSDSGIYRHGITSSVIIFWLVTRLYEIIGIMDAIFYKI
jgi:hypothetical protein